MNRLLGALVSVVMVASGVGCASPGTPGSEQRPAPPPSGTAGSGTLNFYVTDAPPGEEVTSIVVTVSKLEIHKAGGEPGPAQQQQREQRQREAGKPSTPPGKAGQQQRQQGDGQPKEPAEPEETGWIKIDVPAGAATFDLLKIRGMEQYLTSSQVESGKYTQIRLTVDKAQVGLGNKAAQDARVPSGVLRLNYPFEVVSGQATGIVLDFDAEKMVNVTGSGEIQVKPVVKLMSRTEKGKGKPAAIEVSQDDFAAAKNATRELKVSVGESFTVTLASNPTTGCKWTESARISDAAVLQQTEHKYVAPQATGGTAPPAGAAGKEVWSLKALKTGTSTVSLDYSRPWEGGEQKEWTFVLTVTVK